TEGAGCSPNGLVGRNAAGLTLSCQSGVWVATSGKDRWGGSYFYASWAGGGCGTANPYTGNCSCPVGYNANLQFAVAVGGCQPCLSYSCYKP
ncbi:shufflon system plasmid conjugative transfer pilus tip adhesin PilV, partial [Pseudomonas aeruginosa]|nr:shufflon system plasmid conjugative transfer pilus tip adhesin PilV [Pseudomonas aeruginosa]